MLDLAYARDLIVTGILFGFVTFVWSGMGQERPPSGVTWRIVLGLLSVAGLALVAVGVPAAIRHWQTPTALDVHTAAFVWYVIVFWAEVLAIIVLAIVLARRRRSDLLAPAMMVIVGVHLVPLAFVFGQPIILLAAVLITAAGIAAFLLPRAVVAPTFWTAVLGAPVFLAIGAVSLFGALGALD